MRPVVFVSDLGIRDELVGVCHCVVARIAPDARVIDLSHGIPLFDRLAGALVLANGLPYAGPDAVGLAVVDPGVGGARRPVALETAAGPALVGPDNGVLSLAWQRLGGVVAAVDIDPAAVGSGRVSPVFHGRDIFAPAAAHLAAGTPLARIGRPIEPGDLTTVTIPSAEAEPGRIKGEVLDIDRFGNVRLNVQGEALATAGFEVGGSVEVATASGSVRARCIVAYAEVEPNEYGLLVDAWDHLSVVRYEASAAAGLDVGRGDPIWIAAAG